MTGEISLETKTSWSLQWKLCWCLKQFLLAITITCYHTTPTRLTNVNHLTLKTNCMSASILWLGEDGKSAMGPYCLLFFPWLPNCPTKMCLANGQTHLGAAQTQKNIGSSYACPNSSHLHSLFHKLFSRFLDALEIDWS